jgi:hypothetical protein
VLIAGGNAARQSILRPCWGLLMAIEFGEINSCQLSDDCDLLILSLTLDAQCLATRRRAGTEF